jgi:hypothetical protein
VGPRPYNRQTLRARHRPVVRALAEALFSPDGELDAARLDAFVTEVDHFISPASKTLRFGLLVMLEVLRFSPVFVIHRWTTFDALPRGERTRMLEAMEHSRVAELTLIVVAYRTLMTIIFYEADDQLRQIGYPGPERHRFKRALPVAEPPP